MSQGPLCPNLTQIVQKEVSQIANRNFSLAMLLGGLSVNLNHLTTSIPIRVLKQLTLKHSQNCTFGFFWSEKIVKITKTHSKV